MIGDYQFRDVAAKGLGLIGDIGNTNLIKQLSGLVNFCEEAIASLEHITESGDLQVTNTMLKCLQESNDVNNIDKVGKVLKKILSYGENDEIIMEVAFDTLINGKRRAATRFAQILGKIIEKHTKENEKILDKLFDLLEKEKDNNSNLKTLACAIGHVGERGSKRVISKLLELLNENHFSIREMAAISLSMVTRKDDQNVIKNLIKKLNDQNEVVVAAIESLLELSSRGNQEVVKEFVNLLNHPDPGVKQKAVEGLGRLTKLNDKEIIGNLMKLLKDAKDEPLKQLAIESLGSIVTEMNMEVLNELTSIYSNKNESNIIKQVSIMAIGNIIFEYKKVLNEKLTQSKLNSSQSSMNLILEKEKEKEKEKTEDEKNMEKYCNNLIDLLSTNDEKIKKTITKTISIIFSPDSIVSIFKKEKEQRPILFTIIVESLRNKRREEPNFQLSDTSISLLQKMNCFESKFVLLEHAA
jgi:HEAT repeat protein